MDLSIIIVSWNTREVTRDCLKSVFANLGQLKTEVFLVDNASSDGSAEMVAEEFPQAQLIANTKNCGFAAANNQAIRLATGKYVLLLNPDTLVKGEVLTASFNYCEQHPEVGVMACRVLNGDGTVQLTCGRHPSLLNLFLLSSGLFRLRWPKFCGRYQMLDWKRDCEMDVETVTGCYMFVSRKALDEVGMLDESFFCYGEETDWCLRFTKAGWIMRFAPVGEIVHFGSLSSRQCNHRRDVMLTDGLIHLHRKHGGRFQAMLAWGILAGFQATRWVYWSLVSLVRRNDSARRRRDHFWGVLKDYRSLWPTREKYAT
ncbi:MAG: glycosyltransferase family 2 protein [Planctomycetota bacterium]|nr:glycosyltransferase family 2 protein [Planctomycetota bacterium]